MDEFSLAVIICSLLFLNCKASRLQELPQWNVGECLGLKTECPDIKYGRYRKYDGSCTSLGDFSWGRAGFPFTRTGVPIYQDGAGAPRVARDGGPLPNARKISSSYFRDRIAPDRLHTLSVMSWGQLIAHDVTEKRLAFPSVTRPCCTADFRMLPPGVVPKDCMLVKVPEDDYYYSKYGATCLSFFRATPLDGGNCSAFAREQVNNASQAIDGSVLYGSDDATALASRAFVGGKLKSDESAGRAFLIGDNSSAAPCHNPPSERKCYFAGDSRVNQNPGIVALTTALLRLHNHLCARMADVNPHWNDERVYQEVRRIVWAFMQHVTFKQYLPAVLGRDFVQRKGLLTEGGCGMFHDTDINPGVYHEFAAAAFRSFHSLVAREFTFFDKRFKKNGSVRLEDFINRPSFIEEGRAFDELMRGLASQPCQRMDQRLTVGLTNHLFEFDRSYGGDIVIFDIMSGRDMGLPRYAKMRYRCDRKVVADFDDLEDVMTKQSVWKLKKLYASVEDVDLFVGGMMEEVVPGTLVGPTFRCLIGEQFYHFMRGDRFYYENCGFPWSFTEEQLKAIQETTLSWLLCVTGDDIDYIQLNTFYKASSYNPIKPCTEIPHLNLNPWKIDPDLEREN